MKIVNAQPKARFRLPACSLGRTFAASPLPIRTDSP